MAFPPSFLDELIARNPIEEVVGQYVTERNLEYLLQLRMQSLLTMKQRENISEK